MQVLNKNKINSTNKTKTWIGENPKPQITQTKTNVFDVQKKMST